MASLKPNHLYFLTTEHNYTLLPKQNNIEEEMAAAEMTATGATTAMSNKA